MIAKFAIALLLAIASTMCTFLVDAQATVLVVGASGSTSAVQGIVISREQFTNSTGLGLYVPYAYTNLEVAASTSTDLVLVHTNGQSAKAFEWNIIWNFTTSESNTIRTYLGTVSLRNNLEVRFTATWNAEGRFAISTSSWTFVFASLMPYGIGPACNISAIVAGSRTTVVTLPDNCATKLVPGQKQLAQFTPQCLIMHGRTAQDLTVACSTVRAFLETVYCTDGATGVDAVCTYNEQFLPSGVAGTTVLSVGTDGFPTSGRKSGSTTAAPGGSGSAGSVFSGVVAVVAGVIATMMF